MSKFESALGVWVFEKEGFEFELKPTFKDVRDFRKLMLKNTQDKEKLFDEFASYMVEMICKTYPNEPKEIIETNVELYINALFEDAMVQYKWTTKEELEKSKKESMGEIKKLIEDS